MSAWRRHAEEASVAAIAANMATDLRQAHGRLLDAGREIEAAISDLEDEMAEDANA